MHVHAVLPPMPLVGSGHETKIFKNATATPSKRSRVERIVDKIILFMFCILFSMCLTGCIYFAIWTENNGPPAWYLSLVPSDAEQYNPDNPAFVGLASFITSFILYGEQQPQPRPAPTFGNERGGEGFGW